VELLTILDVRYLAGTKYAHFEVKEQTAAITAFKVHNNYRLKILKKSAETRSRKAGFPDEVRRG
jgi:hypothetical protein